MHMYLYFLFIRIAAFFGHKKARLLLRGQRETLKRLAEMDAKWKEAAPVWIHAASVGEFEQARPLIERIKNEQPDLPIVLTFFSPSGYEMRKNYELVDGVFYLPFATRRNARKFIAALQPRMAIFVKYEFWPAYIRELKKQNIPVYSICAIFRKHQYFFRWYGKSQLAVLRRFTNIYVQDEASRRLLAEHGVHNASVAGDTRFDRVYQVQQDNLTHAKGLTPVAHFTEGCQRVIIAGSTWQKDEKLLAEYFEHANTVAPTKLIIVPHELDQEHLHFIFNLFKGQAVSYSAIMNEAIPVLSRVNMLHRADIMVIDTMGLLSSLYRFGQVAYIGGGFGEGIHNTIEAAVYGMPVIFGPNYHHFREAQGLIDAHAAISIHDGKELQQAMDYALENYTIMGPKAANYVASELGTTNTIYNDLF